MRKIDLTGQKFGRLLVIGEGKGKLRNNGQKRITWECKCDCGNSIDVPGYCLKSGNTKSCGCLDREKASNRLKTHGKSGTKLYYIWEAMKQRCYNPNNKRYSDWGGRGITICDEWKNNFRKFEKWAIESGYKEGLTIDRINNDKEYSPNNCRWATYHEQRINQRPKSQNKKKRA